MPRKYVKKVQPKKVEAEIEAPEVVEAPIEVSAPVEQKPVEVSKPLPVYENLQVVEILKENINNNWHRCKMSNGTVMDVPTHLF